MYLLHEHLRTTGDRIHKQLQYRAYWGAPVTLHRSCESVRAWDHPDNPAQAYHSYGTRNWLTLFRAPYNNGAIAQLRRLVEPVPTVPLRLHSRQQALDRLDTCKRSIRLDGTHSHSSQ
jgi:hypothetical protein